MKKLNKHNTALEVSKLSKEEIKEIKASLNYNCFTSSVFPYFFYWVRPETKQYTQGSKEAVVRLKLIIVDFETFKKIHFNAKTS